MLFQILDETYTKQVRNDMLRKFSACLWMGLLKVDEKWEKTRERKRKKINVKYVIFCVLLHFEARATSDNTFNTLILTWLSFVAFFHTVLKGVYLFNSWNFNSYNNKCFEV